MSSTNTSVLDCFNPDAKFNMRDRNTANYHPSIWKDYFLQYASQSMEFDDETKAQIEKLKKEIVKMLIDASKPIEEIVNLIDLICRLGIRYHFESEIEEVLQQTHNNYTKNGEIIIVDDNLRLLALLFRLLRQQGYHVSPNVFNKYKDENGNFSEQLVKDAEGLLELYEACHLRIHGEDILDEAYVFTSTQLKSIATQLKPSLAAQVNYSLRQSLHRGLPRLEARRFISIYEEDPTHNYTLLTLAKLDFNFLQNLHRKEVGNITKWWRELDVAANFPYARDRIVECCNWSMAVYFEPQYSQARKILTKLIALASIIDDTYDAYGTIDELKLFTEAIERWDLGCLNVLPEYMKLIYKSLFQIYEETEQELEKQGTTYCIKYSIKALQETTQAYMTEAKWLNNKYIPTIAEHLQISTLTCGYPFLMTSSYIGIGDTAVEDIFKWVTSKPKIATASTIVCRFMDDIVSSEFEQEREHIIPLLECYMREYDISKEKAIQELQKGITDAWKNINEECLKPTEVPVMFLMRIVNMARFIDVMYKDEDCYTHAKGKMKECIEALLVDPVPIKSEENFLI
ncbi:probable terpene synthase 2 isoform X2 [Arachis stenosperma]|uniref:probable terpene synthase 2 isoform X2 n=1 Tax=Arachis stenosperma TaxID=217475 RepID=UPI0025AD12C9|nr:probable terpene synthase 2 isoform X2 [Arachis stenosperma]